MTADRPTVAPGKAQLSRCQTCGKWCYETRRVAKQAGRTIHPGYRMRVYRCGDYWHLTRTARWTEGGTR